MKIAIFSKIPIAPAHGGNRARTATLVKALAELGADLSFYLIPSRQMTDIDLDEHRSLFGPGNFHIVNRTAAEALIFNSRLTVKVIGKKLGKVMRALRRSRSSDIDYVFPPFAIAGIPDREALMAVDAVIIEYVHFSKILETIPDSVYKVVDTHDSFHDEFTDDAEATGLARGHKVLAMQEREAQRFQRILSTHHHGSRARTEVQVVSHFLDLSQRLSVGKIGGATFLGSSFEANVISVRYLTDEVLPLILNEMPEFQLYIAGSICDDVPAHPSIVKLGRVDTVADAFRAGPILANTIRAGTGLKIKLLEAMGLGVPAVSTKFGVQGIPSEYLSGTVIVGDTNPHTFARKTLDLVKNNALRQQLGAQARACAELWNSTQKAELALLLEAVKRHREQAAAT